MFEVTNFCKFIEGTNHLELCCGENCSLPILVGEDDNFEGVKCPCCGMKRHSYCRCWKNVLLEGVEGRVEVNQGKRKRDENERGEHSHQLDFEKESPTQKEKTS